MIHRKIFKVATTGSREKGNLKPVIADDLPAGLNLTVLEYNEPEAWCVVEVWSSDHPMRRTSEEIAGLMDKVRGHKSVMLELADHPLKPLKIGKVNMGKTDKHKIDFDKKEVTFKGKKGKYKRIEKFREQEIIVLDEG